MSFGEFKDKGQEMLKTTESTLLQQAFMSSETRKVEQMTLNELKFPKGHFPSDLHSGEGFIRGVRLFRVKYTSRVTDDVL